MALHFRLLLQDHLAIGGDCHRLLRLGFISAFRNERNDTNICFWRYSELMTA